MFLFRKWLCSENDSPFKYLKCTPQGILDSEETVDLCTLNSIHIFCSRCKPKTVRQNNCSTQKMICQRKLLNIKLLNTEIIWWKSKWYSTQMLFATHRNIWAHGSVHTESCPQNHIKRRTTYRRTTSSHLNSH